MKPLDKPERPGYNSIKGQQIADNANKLARIKGKAVELADLVGLKKGFYGHIKINFQDRTPVDYHAEVIERL